MVLDRWVLGLDPDATLHLRLLLALRRLKMKVCDDWDPGDLANVPVACPNGRLIIQAETSEGLVLTGSPSLIARVKQVYESLSAESI
jgi:hypothetical protein